jgi:HSP20 family protein
MTRQYYEHIFDELEHIRDYMDSLFQKMQETSPVALLPASHESTRKLLPMVMDKLEFKVNESDDEVIVSVEMVPGDCKKDIKIEIIHPLALKISCVHREWKTEEKKMYSMCEQRYGYFSQIIPLPSAIVEEGSEASIKNEVLEIHLKKRNNREISQLNSNSQLRVDG